MGHHGYSENEHGTRISVHICDTCGEEYTVTASQEDFDPENFQNCLGPDCASYDVNRDVDILFMTDEELKTQKIVPLNIKAKKAALRKEIL